MIALFASVIRARLHRGLKLAAIIADSYASFVEARLARENILISCGVRDSWNIPGSPVTRTRHYIDVLEKLLNQPVDGIDNG